MATVYFTNSAAVGTGSILDAIRRARSGDVVAPDPNAFPAGARIDVQLTSALDLTKSLTFDGRARRVRLIAASYACLIASDSSGSDDFAAFDFEFVGAVRKEGGTARYVRCGFFGGSYASHLVLFSDGAVGTIEDCVISGSRSGGVRPVSSRVTIYRSTIAGNVGGDLVPNTTAYTPTCVDTIVNATASEVGFVNPPPDTLTAPSGRLPWDEWNLRLRPDSPYASGASGAAPGYDRDGLPRGRANGARAIGAYELREDDFVWRGTDDEENEIASPAFGSADGWVDASGAAATRPPTGRLRVDATTAFVDAPPSGASLTVAGGAKVVGVGEWFGEALTLGVGASAEFDGGRWNEATLAPCAALSVVDSGAAASLVLGDEATIYMTGESPAFLVGAGELGSGYFRTTGANVGTARIWSSTDVSDVVFDNTTLATASAGASGFTATALSPRLVEARWDVEDATVPIALERRESGGEWTTIAAGWLTSPLSFELARSGRVALRLYDGSGYFTDDARWVLGVQYRALALAVGAERTEQNWEVVFQMATTSENVMIGQGITILARIYDAFDASAALLNDGANVTSVTYSCYYNSNGLFAETNAPVEGHENVAVGTDAVLEALQISDAWTVDSVGYNFALTPDVREYPLFRQEGRHQIKVEIRLAEGNPIVFYVPVTVVART